MSEADNKPNLTVKVSDNRYPIYVEIDGVEIFALHFNPGDLFAIRCADEMINSDYPTGEDTAAYIEFANKVEKNMDAIFGEGTAVRVFRYESADYALMRAILAKLKEGQEDFAERAKLAQKETKMQAVIDARKEASKFSVPK